MVLRYRGGFYGLFLEEDVYKRQGWSRRKAVIVNFICVLVLSLPCALGFNVFSDFQPLGVGTTIQDLEDFIVSNNLLPLGSLMYLLFCTCLLYTSRCV